MLISYSYSIFYEFTITGVPPMRPIEMEFPESKGDIKNTYLQYMFGPSILVRAATSADDENDL